MLLTGYVWVKLRDVVSSIDTMSISSPLKISSSTPYKNPSVQSSAPLPLPECSLLNIYVETIEIVNFKNGIEVVEEAISTEMFADESDVYRASSGCNLDIVILPERYEHTPSDLSRFVTEAQNIKDYVMSETPFNEFPDKVSWYWPTTVEQMTDQGCESDPQYPEEGDVCGEVSLWAAGCVYCHAPLIYPDYDELYVLINEPLDSAGSADLTCPFPDADLSEGKTTFSWGTNYPGRYPYMAAHELGHSLVGLDDEYIVLSQ